MQGQSNGLHQFKFKCKVFFLRRDLEKYAIGKSLPSCSCSNVSVTAILEASVFKKKVCSNQEV